VNFARYARFPVAPFIPMWLPLSALPWWPFLGSPGVGLIAGPSLHLPDAAPGVNLKYPAI